MSRNMSSQALKCRFKRPVKGVMKSFENINKHTMRFLEIIECDISNNTIMQAMLYSQVKHCICIT